MLRYFLFLALVLQVSAQEAMFREVADTATDTHVEITALFTRPTPGGYLPVRVKIANNLKTDRSIRVSFESSVGYDDALNSESTFDFTAGGGKTLTRDIMVPVSPSAESSGTSTYVTARLSGSLGMASGTVRAEAGPGQPAVLLSEALFTPLASTLDSEANKKFSGRYGSVGFAGKFDPKQLPADWLAFSGYDNVIMTDGDWSHVPAGVRNAILSWVRLGGRLMIYSETMPTLSEMDLPEESGFGSISILPISSGGISGGSGFASDIVREVSANPNKPRQNSIANDYSNSWPLQNLYGARKFRYALFVGVLVIFGILVGPVNLFVFAKAGQRHRLFITTPIISLAASLILIALIIVQDGFGGSGIRRVLMEIRPDAGLNAAYIHQEQFSRTGVLTGSSFTIDTPATLAPVPIARSRWARFTNHASTGSFNLQPGDGTVQAKGDWYQSRSEQGHVLSAVTSTRGRIEETDTPGTYLSTFEFPIDSIYYLDESRSWSRASGVQAGKRFTFAPVDASMADPELQKLANDFGGRHRRLFDAVRERPDHFVAVTTQAPGIGTNPAIRWKETTTVITGPVVAP